MKIFASFGFLPLAFFASMVLATSAEAAPLSPINPCEFTKCGGEGKRQPIQGEVRPPEMAPPQQVAPPKDGPPLKPIDPCGGITRCWGRRHQIIQEEAKPIAPPTEVPPPQQILPPGPIAPINPCPVC